MGLVVTNPETQLSRIVAAVEARLRQGFPPALFDFQLMPAIPSKAEFDRITRRRPFLGLAWAGFEQDKQSRTLKGDAKWILYCVVENKGSVDRRWLGDAAGIGLFGVVSVAGFLLHGLTIDDVGSIEVTGIESLHREDWGDDATAISGIGFDIDTVLGAGLLIGDTPDDFLRLASSWAIPAIEGSAPLPTDLITPRS